MSDFTERQSAGQSAETPPRGMSIQKKLSLLVSGFLIAVIGVYSWASYRAVETVSMDVARQRLGSLTDQLSQLLDQSAKNDAKSSHTLADSKVVREFFASHSSASESAALDTLRKSGTRPELNLRVELLDANGAPVSGSAADAAERDLGLKAEIARAAVAPDFAAVGRFTLLNDTLVLPSVAAVVEKDHPVGFIVRWRRITAAPQARDQLASLLGPKVALYVGNDRGDVWTDLVGPVPKPPAGATFKPGQVSQYTRPGGEAVVATRRAVPGVPWVVLIEFSRDTVMAPAAAFLHRALFLGVIVVLLGTLVVWFVSRSVTRPLSDLTAAATALAAGDFSTVVDSRRADELGDLSRAFNTMVGQVQEAQLGLEDKVRDRTEQLRDRNEELETFAHSISHDLRAPLRAMHGFSQALVEDYGPQLDATGKDYVERVVAGARRMDALIQDLLAYSRVSRADINLVNVSLEDVANEAVAQVEGDVTASGGTVIIAPSMPAVLGHRVALVQAVANLVANGLKFVPPGEKPSVQVRAVQSNGKTRLWVEDNGIGIDPAHHERVFGVFERLHQSEHYPGTGIGLAIVRKSVERMGGSVGLDSSPGNGSRFWIELRSAGAVS